MAPGELLDQILETPVVLCDQVAWSLWGISMAGWNAILSLGLAWLWLARLRLELGVPVEVVHPALVQVVRRELAPDVLQLLRGRRAACGAGSCPPASGSCEPFRRLQGPQEATTFSQVVRPPRERGTTWSKVRWSRLPQYWQVNSSRRNRLKRVKAVVRAGFT